MGFNETAAINWMVFELDADRAAFRDECGTVNLTALAEACAQAHDADGIDGPLDDETHWIWDAVITASDRIN